MRHTQPRHWQLGFALMCAAGLLTSCSSSDDDDNDDGPATSGPTDSQLVPDDDQVPSDTIDTDIGTVLVAGEPQGVLYTRPADEEKTNTCIDTCAENWPPLVTEVTTTDIHDPYDILDRGDGTSQWMFKGYPLYYYQGDANPTDTTGNAVNEAWYVARPDPFDSADTSLGETLVANGSTITAAGDPSLRNEFSRRTLYTFEDDTTEGQSSCNDACADNWPPVYADMGAVADSDYSLITRDDDTVQWAYKGDPLYFYIGDSVEGDIAGNDLPKWSVVLP
ncbi:MAG: hypothetical protein V3U76_10120 [Granulosicoccus sp.]